MKSNLRCAVIGAGNMGQKHIKIFSKLKGANLVAICDLNEKNGRKSAKEHGIKYFKDFKEMIGKEKLDMVSICVPTGKHYLIGKECINKRINVLLEKPICHKVELAESLIDLAEKKKVTLYVGHLERFNPAVVRAKQILAMNKIGKIVQVSAKRTGKAPIKSENNSVAIDLAIHDIDIINHLLGELPQEVSAKKTNNNLVEFELKYKSVHGNVVAAWGDVKKVRSLKVIGTSGKLELDYISQEINFETYSNNESRKVAVCIKKKEPLKEQLDFFLNVVRNNNAISSKFALDALRIANRT